jgi:hypothetical protein
MKNLFFVLFLVIVTSSLAVVPAQSTFLTGKYTANLNSSNYTLDKNSGPRTYLVEINFLNPFESRPEVIVTVSSLDSDNGANLRFNVEATAISRDGFTVKITTWGDSKLFGIGGNWIAYTE